MAELTPEQLAQQIVATLKRSVHMHSATYCEGHAGWNEDNPEQAVAASIREAVAASEERAARAERERNEAREEAQRENADVYHLRAAIIDALMNLGVTETDTLPVGRLALMIKRYTKEAMPLAEARQELERAEQRLAAWRKASDATLAEADRDRCELQAERDAAKRERDDLRGILDDLFKNGAGPITSSHDSGHYCQACCAVLRDHFDDEVSGEHKPECPYSRYTKMKEREKP